MNSHIWKELSEYIQEIPDRSTVALITYQCTRCGIHTYSVLELNGQMILSNTGDKNFDFSIDRNYLDCDVEVIKQVTEL